MRNGVDLGFNIGVPPPPDLDALTSAQLRELVIQLLGEVAALKQTVATQKAEIARLKGLKGPPSIKPSGMERATSPMGSKPGGDKPRRGKVLPRVNIEDQVLPATPPAGSRFKGYLRYFMQDLALSVRAVCFRRERWITPDGQTLIAPLPDGTRGHFGPELRRFALMLYHQGQSTLPRVTALLRSMGVAISERQVQRLLTEQHDPFLREARDVLRAGLQTAAWISVDDTGARHQARNGFCTQVGNDHVTWFGTRACKSRLNFLDVLRAGHTDFVLNAASFEYMRERGLASALIDRLASSAERHFPDQQTWQAHLARLDIAAPTRAALAAIQDPARIATEGTLWGSVQAHGFLRNAVVLSDDAGQFAIGVHALCWARLPKVPRAPRVEWQARGMPSGWFISWTRSPTFSARRSTRSAR